MSNLMSVVFRYGSSEEGLSFGNLKTAFIEKGNSVKLK